jgi:outer membrane protein OmpA-like peptidoglycan-associated protein
MQQVKTPAVPEGTAEKRRSVKRTADTSPVFAAALERLNRRSVIDLIEEVIEQLNEHCEKIGISIEQNVAINTAYSKLEMHLHDLRVANDNCMIEINSIRQEINSLHAYIPCISVIEKIEALNKKIDTMSEIKPPTPPKNKENKLAWCSSCFCIAAFILASAALAIVLHTEYHRNVQQQGQARLAVIESRLKQLDEQQTRQSSSHIAVVSVLETTVVALETELKRLLNAKHGSAAAGKTQEPSQTAAVSTLEAKVAALETKLLRIADLLDANAKQNSAAADQARKTLEQVAALEDKLKQLEERQAVPPPSNNTPQEPSKITVVSALETKVLTLETNLQLMATLFKQNQQEIKQAIAKLDQWFQQKIDIHTQGIAKLEQCCAAKPAPAQPPAPIDPKPEPKPVLPPPAEPSKPEQPEKKTIIDPNKDIIVLSGVNFDRGTSNLTEGAKKILTDVAATLKDEKLSKQKFEVAGHTDNAGTTKMNQRLSQNRAEAVRQFLIAQGIKANLLTSKGYGADKPVAENTTSEGQAKNRRVELDKQ